MTRPGRPHHGIVGSESTPPWAALTAEIIRGAPALPWAACRFEPPELFDVTDEALAGDALAVCNRCRELPTCRVWLESLPPRRRPGGVVAGQVMRP